MSGQWRLAHRTLPAQNEVVSGDVAVLRAEGDDVLVAVVDALGHGPRAAEVATQAQSFLMQAPWPSPSSVLDMIEGLHQTLRGSRGAAALLLFLHGDRVEACGVGNVDLRCIGASLPVALTPGILGSNLTRLRLIRGQVQPGARLFVFSDGLSSRSPFSSMAAMSPDEACDLALREHRHHHDDATIAAAYLDKG